MMKKSKETKEPKFNERFIKKIYSKLKGEVDYFNIRRVVPVISKEILNYLLEYKDIKVNNFFVMRLTKTNPRILKTKTGKILKRGENKLHIKLDKKILDLILKIVGLDG